MESPSILIGPGTMAWKFQGSVPPYAVADAHFTVQSSPEDPLEKSRATPRGSSQPLSGCQSHGGFLLTWASGSGGAASSHQCESLVGKWGTCARCVMLSQKDHLQSHQSSQEKKNATVTQHTPLPCSLSSKVGGKALNDLTSARTQHKCCGEWPLPVESCHPALLTSPAGRYEYTQHWEPGSGKWGTAPSPGFKQAFL